MPNIVHTSISLSQQEGLAAALQLAVSLGEQTKNPCRKYTPGVQMFCLNLLGY
jgi:hypothetical protein